MMYQEFESAGCEHDKCSFCGERKPNGIWMGNDSVFCCKPCAIEVLPQLLADAVLDGTHINTIKNGQQPPVSITQENSILKNYHAAFNKALIRKVRENNT
ncbi:hypothetical protein HYO33_23565 [Vibrio parahaemolyticus]|uniref:hypothetical protein n=1 Tax=Vibrio TaxID=662 RepID=UPI00111E5FA7|nr:hypothetical protein [Vibrio parahaemolyticus]EIO4097950.1 hypothetical protein [Vibrio parahaemolyticus]EIY9802875.1 hypothetical protein [Vibrio parahaemolyticus]EJE4731043.1 hypothetical protein [Vibrio parahaemolyticus]MBE4169250.1 hypothetical protein [Vibrio parahaemolyticus]MBM4910114.1 hypothetical protein [Vibrio parahaemolyticus]